MSLVLLLAELVPAGHAEHDTSPSTFLYVPGLQALQVAPLAPQKPVLHIQSDAASLAAGDCEFEGHDVHISVPTVNLYLPASHAPHEAP